MSLVNRPLVGELKGKIETCLKTVNVSIYFHNGVEIEFGAEILLGQLFGPESINDQGDAQVENPPSRHP